MYKLNNLEWLPQPHSLKFVKQNLKNYQYTSTIIFAIKNQRIALVKVKSRGWDFVGGRIDDGENIKACARREFLEETGYRVKNLKFIGSHKIDAINNSKGSKTAQAIYIGELDKKISDVLEDDVEEVGWFSLMELAQFDFPEWKMKLLKYAHQAISKRKS